MNLLDKAIGWFAPGLALERVRQRIVLDGVQSLAYDGANVGRRTGGWVRPGTSANAETSSGVKLLRDGARAFVRNNPQASSAMLHFETKLVGTGIRPQAKTGKPSVDKVLDDAFEEWARQTGYYAMQGLAARTIPESGEGLLRFKSAKNRKIPLGFDLLEPDYLDTLKTETMGKNGGYIIQGVEFDRNHDEVALWMFQSHPGDSFMPGIASKGLQSERMPVASTSPLQGIVRGYKKTRPQQVRGVSWFAPIMTSLWDLSGYEEAERVRKRIESCLAAFVTTPMGEVSALPIGPQSKSPEGHTIEEFRPGAINRLRPGETVVIAEPKAAGGYIDYTRRQDRLIAVGLGMLYELMAGDLSQVNYSSYRGGLTGLRDFIETVQWGVIIPFVCDPVWERFVRTAILAGIVPTDTPATVAWSPPYFDFLDREAEANADRAEMRSGVQTWDQLVGRRGYDPAKQAAEIEARNKDWDARGIVLDCDPRRTRVNGTAQAPAETGATSIQ